LLPVTQVKALPVVWMTLLEPQSHIMAARFQVRVTPAALAQLHAVLFLLVVVKVPVVPHLRHCPLTRIEVVISVLKALSHLQVGTLLTVATVKPLPQLQLLLTMVPSKLGLLAAEHTKHEPLPRMIAETLLSQTQVLLLALHT
jgi:hypothetical protein